ncbi:helix-turn-helix transcriptional regulator [Leuconostoc pseudomesenteroides]|uniref:helix-turn-helix transcriptional regulator n=1 Tax=Leuconostoc pseudomesenteroides TaxID=33968 RepID=UPI0039EB6CD5
MSFEQDIKQLRLQKKMTQQELADEVHVSRQTVSTWETGKNYPSLDVLRRLSDLFDVSFEKIMFGEEIDMTDKQKSIAEAIDQDVSLKHRYKRLTMILGSIFVLLVLWLGMLLVGYQKGIDTIDRMNPFLQYKVAYTKMPSDKVINANSKSNNGYWTKWFSDNDMGTEWTKLTLMTGLNPGVKDPYVMAYHKGSYVKIARIVPGSSVKDLQNKKHFNKVIQELVVQ